MRDATLDGSGGGGGRIAAVVTTGFTVWFLIAVAQRTCQKTKTLTAAI